MHKLIFIAFALLPFKTFAGMLHPDYPDVLFCEYNGQTVAFYAVVRTDPYFYYRAWQLDTAFPVLQFNNQLNDYNNTVFGGNCLNKTITELTDNSQVFSYSDAGSSDPFNTEEYDLITEEMIQIVLAASVIIAFAIGFNSGNTR